MNDQRSSVTTAKLESPQPVLTHAAFLRVQIEPLHDVTGNDHVGNARDILVQKPFRRGFDYNPGKLLHHLDAVARRGRTTHLGKILTG